MNLHNYVYHNIFNDTAKNKKIGKNGVDTDEETQNVDDNESFVYQENPVTSNESHTDAVDMSSRTSKDKNNDYSYSLILDDSKQYKCQQCDYQSAKKSHVERHIQVKHEEAKYLCHQCDHKAATQINLKNHIESKHEGIKYPCQQCDYQATQAGHLQQHVKSKH